MSAPLKIAVLSAWHVHAGDYANSTLNHPDTELVAVWDDHAERGSALAEKFGVEFVSDLDALLARKDLDGVTVTTATTDHDAVLGKVIAAGKHIFTEKLLSPTAAGCESLIAAADQAGIAMTVSLPRLSHGYTVALRSVLEAGTLGRLTYSRIRLAHNGSVADWLPARFYDAAEAIGGAFSDLGAHPVYLTQLILGSEVASVHATYTDMTGRGVEDNASVTISTPDGAIGVIETGFVTPSSPFTIEIHGTEGSLLYGFGAPKMLLGQNKEWTEVDIPAEDPEPFEQWVHAIHTGGTTPENLQQARDLTALVEAANAAAK